MAASTVLIIRHAEKPSEAWPGPGLTRKGEPDEASLVIRGWQRAGAWAALFAGGRRDGTFPEPTAIYAANPTTTPKGMSRSTRALDTVRPLAKRLGIGPKTQWGRGEESDFARAIDAESGVVLVCWEHKLIVQALLPALFGGHPPAKLPRKWPSSRFDLALRLDRAGSGEPWSFHQLFPCLLDGDSTVPI